MDSFPNLPDFPYNYDAVSAELFDSLFWPHEKDKDFCLPADEKVPTTEPRRRRVQIPGCSTFHIKDLNAKKPVRSNYKVLDRQRVARVRQLGACLRCKAMKISVKHLPNLVRTFKLLMINISAPKVLHVRPVQRKD